ncbi:Nac domain containing protein [Thalictrum thalictroides]|uniref:Nac domain containing protein n=1 Tax=Thalictrum thalictroides TaxID=46969 RepID=A0A7J6VDS7_THATH|nr:Nac domain containing protein [Thalictrum thalictroides]
MRYPPPPPGYRFLPTDEELLKYLKLKIGNSQFKCDMITAEANFFKYNPEMLFDKYRSRSRGENSCYFFTPRDRKYKMGSRPDRRTGGGFYRASGKDKPVVNKNGQKIGTKRTLVYYKGVHKNPVKTNWLMVEYVIEEHQLGIDNQTNSMRLDDCVVCKIYYNPKKSKNRQLEQGESSKSQCEGRGGGGGGHENEAAGRTEGEHQIVAIGTDCSEEVLDQGEMMNFVEQTKVETEMGKRVDKGKGVLQEDDHSVDMYLNLDDFAQFMPTGIPVDPSCPSSSLGYLDNNIGYVSNPLSHQIEYANMQQWPVQQ